jgi:hypothetical protein
MLTSVMVVLCIDVIFLFFHVYIHHVVTCVYLTFICMVHEQIDMPTPNKYLRGNSTPIHARVLPTTTQALLAPKPTLVNKHNKNFLTHLMNDNNVITIDN